jgi:hypothetical protein
MDDSVQGRRRSDGDDAPQAAPGANRSGAINHELDEPRRRAEHRWSKLAWVMGWPPLFIGAFVASTIVHNDADEVEGSLSLGNGVSSTEWALVLAGLGGIIIWLVGCFVIVFLDD